MLCWGLTPGQAGMVAQVKALASALNLTPQMKTVTLKKPFVWLPSVAYANPLRRLIVPYLLSPESDSLAPPLPDLVISCGRRAALVAMSLKASSVIRHPSSGATRFIHIQDPQVSAKYFDVVVAMAHDKITGLNVIKTQFALHAITPAVLEQARQTFSAQFSAYPKPLVTVLLGGSTNKYTLTKENMAQLVMVLKQFLETTQVSLLITPSRRTGEENIAMLRQVFTGDKRVYIYDFTGENPYLGMLALADAMIVTNDSVNMMSEACASGKPVYLLNLPGHADTKPARFAAQLIASGIARPLGTRLENWSYSFKDEMAGLADDITRRLM